MFMKLSTHLRLMAEQVRADDTRYTALLEQTLGDMAAFKHQIVEQAAHENEALRREVVELRGQIAALNGKLVHVRDNPEPAVEATSGLK